MSLRRSCWSCVGAVFRRNQSVLWRCYCRGRQLKVASRWDRWDLLGLGKLGRSVAAGAGSGAARESNARVRLPASAAHAAHEAAIRDLPPKCRRRVAVGADNGSCPETGGRRTDVSSRAETRMLDAGMDSTGSMDSVEAGGWVWKQKGAVRCASWELELEVELQNGAAACACSSVQQRTHSQHMGDRASTQSCREGERGEDGWPCSLEPLGLGFLFPFPSLSTP